ncbi:flagellar motor switch protein FliG [Cryobacterium sp. Hh11]|uniref:flagellar motor switch protein FliG n=1 Tax=Cryobacterium sp. Hh11 TaxID=2555868 RepID=UPI00106B3CD0|nr:flagellar motor switch protein FliG [Cryobacterium sp. Hh11]TFD51407.1 flagellar motor switch protein FliG [Cryobacterium sp. Hh11]
MTGQVVADSATDETVAIAAFVAATPNLTGSQKVAVVLLNMERTRATSVMKQFSDVEAEAIAAEIVQLSRIDGVVAASTINEFHGITVAGGQLARGGHDFAVGLLEASFGAERAAGVMTRVATSMAGKAFEFLDAADPSQVLSLLDGELPQTIALVLAHLRREQASAVFSGMDPELRTEVALSIASMGSAAPEAVRTVTDILKLRAGSFVGSREALEVAGGVQPLVEIINRTDVATERALLEALDLRDPELAVEVRSHMLTFVDIIKLDSRDVQKVLRGLDTKMLSIAMKGAPEAVVEVIRANLSERNRSILDDEASRPGTIRMRQIDDARAEIVRAIRSLEAQGLITVQRGEEEIFEN